jgi:hypothetical protein
MADLPIACTLGPDALKARKDDLLGHVVRASRQTTALPTGFRFEFEPAEGTLREVAEMIDAERRCCRFLRFALSVEPDLGPIQLDVTGPSGTREFLAALLEID